MTPAASTTFYKRPLPSGCVPFASDLGRELFREALSEGTMSGYFALAEQFHTQADPAFCGLGTLVVVLNALAIDPGPGRSWKGPWRWFAEEHLDCCRPLAEIQRTGLTIPQLACLARCNGARVAVHYGETSSLEAFRRAVREAASTAGEPHLVLSYDRATLGQTGSGHFSPVGGYHAGRDLALVLDVARFKYPPHWVPLATLFAAMQPHDAETGRSRGFLQLWRRSAVASICSLQATDASWRSLLCELFGNNAGAASSLEELLQLLLPSLPVQTLARVRQHAAERVASTPAEEATPPAQLWQELEQTELMRLLRRVCSRSEPDLAAAALFLFSLPASVLRGLPPALRERLEALQQPERLPPLLREQVEYLRMQAEALDELSACPPSRSPDPTCAADGTIQPSAAATACGDMSGPR